ncbi:MAG: hypothetical protein K2M64_04005 [Clostridia bacterium]|nr:hypothetical protein [Clostridia bacterium]
MNLFYETLIIIVVALFQVAFASLICFSDEHFFIKTKGLEEKHYFLKKSKFLFVFPLAVNWNLKNGIIRKSSFWATIGYYIYFLCFYIADVIYYAVSTSCMVITAPIYWVVFMVILPIVISVVYLVVKCVIYIKKKADIVD